MVAVEDRADEGALGIGVAYDYRSAGSVHVLLSTMAVTDLIGPGYGWTLDGARLLLNAIEFGRDAEQAIPAAPTLATEAVSPTTAETAVLTGTAEFRSTVSILRDGAVIATAEPDRDGAFSVEVTLVEGPNALTAVATNHAGDSPASNEVVIVRDTTGPLLEWTPADGDGFFGPEVTVAGTAIDAHASPVTLAVNVDLAGGGRQPDQRGCGRCPRQRDERVSRGRLHPVQRFVAGARRAEHARRAARHRGRRWRTGRGRLGQARGRRRGRISGRR
jgi:hypothetical protein